MNIPNRNEFVVARNKANAAAVEKYIESALLRLYEVSGLPAYISGLNIPTHLHPLFIERFKAAGWDVRYVSDYHDSFWEFK